jgi:streptomycin 6-kinase
MFIPERLARTCTGFPEREQWLAELPAAVEALADRWALHLGAPLDHDGYCSWIAPVTRADGRAAMLKFGMPHMEADHEIAMLRLADGDPMVRLYDADEASGAMLLERCVPGTRLADVATAEEQDRIVARTLRRVWRLPAVAPFRPLSEMLRCWSDDTLKLEGHWLDPALVRDGLALFTELPRTAAEEVLLATDLHAGNILQAEREPWLMIDPKPFVGDPAYDATQHLFNHEDRVRADPRGTIARFAGLLDVDAERLLLWMFARAAAEDSVVARSTETARALASVL